MGTFPLTKCTTEHQSYWLLVVLKHIDNKVLDFFFFLVQIVCSQHFLLVGSAWTLETNFFYSISFTAAAAGGLILTFNSR